MAVLDALSNIGGQAVGSIIGNVAKAIIEIEDERVQPEEITVTQERSRSVSGGSLPGGGALNSITQAGGAQAAAFRRLLQTFRSLYHRMFRRWKGNAVFR